MGDKKVRERYFEKDSTVRGQEKDKKHKKREGQGQIIDTQ